MEEWTRREWLQGAAAAASNPAAWSLAFRLHEASVFVPDGGQCFRSDPARPEYADRVLAGEPLVPAPYELLTGRYGLLNSAARLRIQGPDVAGLRLDAAGRDAPRLAQLRERIFLARPAQRGPLVWSPTRAIARARVPSLPRTQIEMLLEHEARRKRRGFRGAQEIVLLSLDGGGASPLVWAQAVWRAAFAVQATVASLETPSLDTVWTGTPAELPEPRECFSCGGALLLAVRRPSADGTIYEIWTRSDSGWRVST